MIRKYLARNFLDSIRSLIADRVHGETPEDACLSFLFRAEICTKSKTTYRVIATLVYAAVRFIIAETRNYLNNISFFEKFFVAKHEFEMKTKLVEWLSILGISNESGPHACSPIVSSPLMLTMVNESRDGLNLLYREMVGSTEQVEWEMELQKRVKACERLAKADLRLLITTANGLGISPVPFTEEPSVVDLTVLNDEEVVEHPPPPLVAEKSADPLIIAQLMEELKAVREEMAISKRNSEILYMELSRVKHRIAMDEDKELPDEKIGA